VTGYSEVNLYDWITPCLPTVEALCETMESRRSDMRVAVISDIHGNLTAFEAVLADANRVCGGTLAAVFEVSKEKSS
jgi:hypothetical protein